MLDGEWPRVAAEIELGPFPAVVDDEPSEARVEDHALDPKAGLKQRSLDSRNQTVNGGSIWPEEIEIPCLAVDIGSNDERYTSGTAKSSASASPGYDSRDPLLQLAQYSR